MRSVKCVSEHVNKNNSLAYKAFTTIAYAIPQQNSQDDVYTLFNILQGNKSIESAVILCNTNTFLSELF
jgi:hypothetical protein